MSSSEEIVVVGSDYSCTLAGAFNVPPVSQLGTRFVAVSYRFLWDGVSQGPYVVAVMATSNATHVTVTCQAPDATLSLATDSLTCGKGQTMSITLGEYQTVQVGLIRTNYPPTAGGADDNKIHSVIFSSILK